MQPEHITKWFITKHRKMRLGRIKIIFATILPVAKKIALFKGLLTHWDDQGFFVNGFFSSSLLSVSRNHLEINSIHVYFDKNWL